jgi:hypothetical protein
MRKFAIALLCAIAVPCAAGAQTQAQGWTYAYVEGVATATQRNDDGRVTATLTCRPPDGNIVVTDFTFGRAARNVSTAAVGIGNMTVNVPATSQGRGRNAQVVINLPQRPPILAGVQPTDGITVTVNNETRTYGAHTGMLMKDVAYACWGS